MARRDRRRARGNAVIWGLLFAPSLLGAAEPPSRLTFERDILPLVQRYCWECHGGGAHKGGLDLRTLQGARKGGEGGEPAVVPHNLQASPLFELVSSGQMPPKGKPRPTTAEVFTIRRWIETGAAGNPVGTGEMRTEAGGRAEQARKVHFLLEMKCQKCHGRKEQKGGLDLRTRQSMLQGGKSGPALVAGDPAGSAMIRRIAADQMPPREVRYKLSIKPVTEAERRLIERWIATGAADPAPAEVLAEGGRSLRDADRKWWSFQPPRRAALPQVKDRARLRTPIDAFVLSKLEALGLGFALEADRGTLIRRAFLDLIGLPPTSEEVFAFQKDADPAAYERMIDRLLASPHYGERWGQHWLDAAGYAESEGSAGADPVYPDMYRYRDYVIRAHNADKPFDRFLFEQLAGDELVDYAHQQVLGPEAADNLIATGFLRTAIDPTASPETNFSVDRHQVLADTVEIVSSALLGLTMRCARCHSHKYDPLSQGDYYAFTAIFAAAFAPQEWLKPADRSLPLAGTVEQEAIRRHNAAVEAKTGPLRKQQDALAATLTTQLMESRVAALAEPMRAEVRKALQTTAAQRSDKQKELAAPFEKKIGPKELATAFPEYDKKAKSLRDAIAGLEKSRRQVPKAHGLTDVDAEAQAFYFLRRGEWDNRGPMVRPNVPAVFRGDRSAFVVQPPRLHAATTGRRLALARWLTRPDQPLTARVLVNRVWQLHFGAGIVATPEDFGRTGARPTHPELLDWLACEFVERGWSMKDLHRLIMTSSVYRQQSGLRTQETTVDPENRLLSRMPLRRLDAEVLRDSILAVAGQLNLEMFGPPVPVGSAADGQVLAGNNALARRRSIYLLHRRSTPLTILETFDAPRMTTNCVQRRRSTVVSQALLMFNSQLLDTQATQLAEAVVREAGVEPAAQVVRAYERILSRAPTLPEKSLGVSFLDKQAVGYRERPGASAGALALADFCLVLLNSAEFLYVD